MDVIGKLLGSWAEEFNIYSCILKISICVVIGITIGGESAEFAGGRAKNVYVRVVIVRNSGNV